jgi:membrane-associated phospholipid phosphatase
MRTSELVNLVYFSALTILALVWTLPSHSRTKAVLIGLIGLALNGTTLAANRWLSPDAADIFRDWLPVPLMALAYWLSGCFFQKANPRLQAMFEHSDRRILKLLHVDLTECANTWLGGFLELAYLLCYPVVPLGLGALYVAGLRHQADDYWTVVLLSAYPCYSLLPFVQLLPPRLVEENEEATNRSSNLRRFNLWLVRRVTHEANTFPSGHVAASAAIAMALLRFSLLTGMVFVLIALGIAVGCVVGRYHYVVDVGAAFLLSATPFAIISVLG